MKIMLDAGHYGKYNQSPTIKEFYESDFNWKISKYLGSYLEMQGHSVAYTRTKKDIDMNLYNRGFKAKGYDVFISLHANACDDPSVDFPVVIRGYDQGATDKLAQLLAEGIEEILDTKQAGKTWVRKSRSGGEYYGVLRGAKAAGVKYRFIIEHSFYTNKRIASMLLQENTINRLAKKESDIISRYFGVNIKKLPKYIMVTADTLNIRDEANWNAEPTAKAHKNEIFTVKDIVNIKNSKTQMYLLKSNKYITTCEKYIKPIY